MYHEENKTFKIFCNHSQSKISVLSLLIEKSEIMIMNSYDYTKYLAKNNSTTNVTEQVKF